MKKILLFLVFVTHTKLSYSQKWIELGSGPNPLGGNASTISSLCTDDNNNVYAAGTINDGGGVGSVITFQVAKWNGIEWSELGSDSATKLNANYRINSICAGKGNQNIYAAGQFTNMSGAPYVAMWNGTNWSELGSGTNALHANNAINTICVDDSNNIYAGGQFRDNSGYSYVAKWNGIKWDELGGKGFNGFIYSLCVDDSFNVYVAGDFVDSFGLPYVAELQNSTGSWIELGSGFDSGIHEPAAGNIFISSIALDSLNNVYVAVNTADSLGIYGRVFRWDWEKWDHLDTLSTNNIIYSICTGGRGKVYAAGSFHDSMGKYNVYEWDNNINKWKTVGIDSDALNANNSINALCVDGNGNVYAGGSFTVIDTLVNKSYVAEYIINTSTNSIIFNKSTFKVFPNPVNADLFIKSDVDVSEVKYFFFDCVGRQIQSGVLSFNADKINELPLYDFCTGLYFLRIKDTTFPIFKL